jgi:hypothetical protein
MNMTVGAALLCGGILLFWCTMIATRLAQPPRWTGDTMLMCFIAPAIIFLVVTGGAMLGYLLLSGTWQKSGMSDLGGVAAVLVIAVVTALLLARWSRRAPRAVPADVIPITKPESPEPPRPAPQLGAPRKAA